MPQPDPAQLTDLLNGVIAATPFAQLAGTYLIEAGGGTVSFAVPHRTELLQHNGFLHGGVIAYIADTACAWAAATVAGNVLTAQLNLHLLAPGIGDRFIGKGRVLKASKRQIVCASDVYAVRDGVEVLIATATATIMRHDPAAGAGA